MRTADQTLLSKLGFQDPDKKTPLHDQICEYIALNSVHVANYLREDKSQTPWSVVEVEMERLITKGTGIYQTHVGFIDVFLFLRRPDGVTTWKDGTTSQSFDGRAAYFEVKTNRISVSEALRQIKVYKQFISGGVFTSWALITVYEMSDLEKELLRRENITHATAASLGFQAAGRAPTPFFDQMGDSSGQVVNRSGQA
jgi:hypothetical protein